MKFKSFQLEDYSRFALHDGGVLAHDTGTGKSVAEFAIPMLWCGFSKVDNGLRPDAPVLLVVPGDGHEQTRDEGKKHFRTKITTLDSQSTFLRLSTVNPRSSIRQLPPAFYITSYTDLTSNGVTPFPDLASCLNHPLHQHPLFLTPDVVNEFFETRASRWRVHYNVLNATTATTLPALTAQWQQSRAATKLPCVIEVLDNAWETLRHVAPNKCFVKCQVPSARYQDLTPDPSHLTPSYLTPSLDDLDDDQLDWLRRECIRSKHKEYSAGIGESRSYPLSSIHSPSCFWTVKCCYSPSLADLCSNSFECVSVDEGTKMKGEETRIGLGVRQMNPRYRLVLTATPIKNRLPDVFSLLVWASHAGPDGNARFPYGDTPQCRADFEKEFLLQETNLTKTALTGKRNMRLTPKVNNIHRLWQLFAPLVLRRRKKDCGEDIVPKHRHVVRCPMGKHQAEVYQYHLDAQYRDKNKQPAIGAQLQALRVVAANPASQLLERPTGDKTPGPPRSLHPYVPKLASVLGLLRDLLSQNEQAVVFSAFCDSLDALAARLNEAGVAHVICDGRMTPKARGRAAKDFKKGKFPVMLAGIESMAELHSFSQCSHVLLMAYSWAFDKFEQAINRVHRMDSPKDVHVWSFLCDGSIDVRLEGNIHEKSDSSELVLDGQLLGEQTSEVNLWELLRDAQKEFRKQKAKLTDENELEKTWPALRSQIAAAAARWPFVKCQVPSARYQDLTPDPSHLTPSLDDLTPDPSHLTLHKRAETIIHEPQFADLPLWTQTKHQTPNIQTV